MQTGPTDRRRLLRIERQQRLPLQDHICEQDDDRIEDQDVDGAEMPGLILNWVDVAVR